MNKELIENQKFIGERAEYYSRDKIYKKCSFIDGESQIKHGKNLYLDGCSFEWKYPLWNCEKIEVIDSRILEMGRAGIWYSNNLRFENVHIDAPKQFRRCDGVFLKKVEFTNAEETFWSCKNVEFDDVTVKGDYFGMNSENLKINNLKIDGNYPFDGGKNIEVRNSRLISKDAFWNCENVVIYDSFISGEYFGWESKNITLVNCTIESEQGLCYIENLKMVNCRLENTNLSFEYSKNIDAEIAGEVISVKNPASGVIKADKIGTLIMNPNKIDVNLTQIICECIGEQLEVDPNPNEA